MRDWPIETFRNMLRVNKHRLDDELEMQAQVLEFISSRVARLNSLMLEAKEALKRTEGSLALDLKDAKMLKDELLGRVYEHRDYKAAWGAYQVARQEHEEWEGLYKAWAQRGKDIDGLGRLYGAQYWQVDALKRREAEESPRAVVERAREERQREREPSTPTLPSRPRRSLLT